MVYLHPDMERMVWLCQLAEWLKVSAQDFAACGEVALEAASLVVQLKACQERRDLHQII